MSTLNNWLVISDPTSPLANSSTKYVDFMCRGMHCERGKRRGVDFSSYEKFKEADFQVSKETRDATAIANYNYQLTLIKGFVIKALDNSKRRVKANGDAMIEIDQRIFEINIALTKLDIEMVINESLATFNKYSINLPPINNF